MSTVRGQLTVLVAGTTSLVLLAFLVPLGLVLRNAAEERALSAATLQAQAVAALVAVGQEPPDRAGGSGGTEPVVSVFYPDGRVAGAPARRTASIGPSARGRAFTADSAGGIEVLVPVQGLPGGTAVVRSYVPRSLLHQGVGRAWAALALVGMVLGGLGLALADRMGGRLVGSVTALADAADRLATGDLTARVQPSGTRELRGVGTELNRLASRIQELLAAQREEVADLAHRLRTPVTAMRLDVDSLRDPSERQRLGADVDSLGQLVDEVIRTARRPVREGAGASADLVAVTADRVAFWSALADDVGRPMHSVLPDRPVLVRVSPEDLTAALDVLLDNIFSHTPDGAAVRVEVVGDGMGGGRVTVDDAGPGIDSQWRHGRGISRAGSTGLGLDIARRTAESAHGSMSIVASPLGGTRVQLDFGPPA